MSQVARIESALGFNDAEFTNGIARAEKRAQTFAGRVETSFQGLFRRTPGRKAEKALTGFITDLTTGSVSQGIFSLANRFTGLGLVAGVGLGVAVEVGQKLLETMKATDDASRKLFGSLAGLGGAKGPEQIKKQFQDINEQTRLIVETSSSVTGKLVSAGSGLMGLIEGKPSQRNKNIAQSIMAGFRGQGKLLEQGNQSEFADEFAKERSVTAGSREGDIAKIKLALARKKSSIDDELGKFKLSFFDPAVIDKVDPKQRDALIKEAEKQANVSKVIAKRAADFEIQQTDRTFDAKKSKYDLDEKIAKLGQAHGGKVIGEDIQKRLRGQFELEDINEQLKTAIPDEKRALQIAKINKENEVRSLAPRKKNPFAFGTIANRQYEEDQGGFGTIEARNRETNDPGTFGSLANSAMQRGESAMTQTGGWSELAGLMQKLIDLETRVWATP